MSEGRATLPGVLEAWPPEEELERRAAERCAAYAPPPRVELPRLEGRELLRLAEEGSGELDALERALAMASRVRGAIDLALAEGLLALTRGDRLLQLGLRLDDYAREVLDLQPRTAMKRVRLARQLRTRPLLRDALRTGKVSLRAAEVVAPVARGEAESAWVERAASETVRALEALVREERPDDEDDRWGRLTVGASGEELAIIDEALEVAGQQLPGSKRFERLEAMAQEFLGGHPEVVPEGDAAPVGLWRGERGREDAGAALRARREAETDRWSTLERIPRWREPDLRWEGIASAAELDATLRMLTRHREGWDELTGWAACELSRPLVLQTLGFVSFGHYVEERLGLPPRALEQRARLEQQLRRSPALDRARAEGVSYERLRLLALLPEKDILDWIPRAKDLTVIALRDQLEARERAQMRAARRLAAAVPERVATLLASAFEAVRALAGAQLAAGTCLAVLARHFLDTHGPPARLRTPSQKVRARDRLRCTAPGCSHSACHAHHVEFLSQGGARVDPANQTSVCAFHHECVHAGHLGLAGTAPGGLAWTRRGRPFRGRW